MWFRRLTTGLAAYVVVGAIANHLAPARARRGARAEHHVARRQRTRAHVVVDEVDDVGRACRHAEVALPRRARGGVGVHDRQPAARRRAVDHGELAVLQGDLRPHRGRSDPARGHQDASLGGVFDHLVHRRHEVWRGRRHGGVLVTQRVSEESHDLDARVHPGDRFANADARPVVGRQEPGPLVQRLGADLQRLGDLPYGGLLQAHKGRHHRYELHEVSTAIAFALNLLIISRELGGRIVVHVAFDWVGKMEAQIINVNFTVR